MIGDKIIPTEYHYAAAGRIMEHITKLNGEGSFSICIAGESGSGKSEMAFCLKEYLEDYGKQVYILGQDDYFKLPPHSNHAMRKKDISWVGPGEVKLKLMNEHVQLLLSQEEKELVKPLVYFEEDRIDKETIKGPYEVVIAEGTYTSLLDDIHIRVFIDRDYRETKKDRLARNRDQALEGGEDQELSFLEAVLSIEHKIIREHKKAADIVIPAPELLVGK